MTVAFAAQRERAVDRVETSRVSRGLRDSNRGEREVSWWDPVDGELRLDEEAPA